MKVEVYLNSYYLFLKFDKWDQIPMTGDHVIFNYKHDQEAKYMQGVFIITKRTFDVEANTWSLYVNRI